MDNVVQSATLLAFALLATSCASKSVTSPDIRLQRWGRASSPYTMLSNFREPSQRAIRTQEEWNEVWDNLGSGPPGAATPPPLIDFHRETVIVAALGSRSTGGNRIIIESAVRSPQAIVVIIREFVAPESCLLKLESNQPVDIARIDVAGSPVRFEVRRTESCE